MISLYVLRFNDNAAKNFEKLPKEISSRIWEKLQVAKTDPLRYFFRLKNRPDYKLRAGSYRVIADIKINEKLIEVTKIGHRRNIYKQ